MCSMEFVLIYILCFLVNEIRERPAGSEDALQRSEDALQDLKRPAGSGAPCRIWSALQRSEDALQRSEDALQDDRERPAAIGRRPAGSGAPCRIWSALQRSEDAKKKRRFKPSLYIQYSIFHLMTLYSKPLISILKSL